MAVLRAIDAIPLDLPLTKPINLGGRLRVERAETVLVRVEDADGAVGWGECAPAPNLTGETRDQMLDAIRNRIVPALLGQDGDTLAGIMLAAAPTARGARAAVDCALLDLLGRRRGVPVHALLGGARRGPRLEIMWMIGTASIDEDVAEATARRRDGYRVFKLKVGSRALEDDLRATALVRAAIGADAILYADANGTMDEARAIAYGRRAADHGVAYLEQPLPAADIGGMARVAAAIPMPVCVDEGIQEFDDIARFAAARAGAGAALRPVKLGGLTVLRKACRRAAASGWKINLPGKIAETSLATAALLHAAIAAENLDWAITPTNHYLAEDIAGRPLAVTDGAITLPDSPGLGIAPDADRIREFRRR